MCESGKFVCAVCDGSVSAAYGIGVAGVVFPEERRILYSVLRECTSSHAAEVRAKEIAAAHLAPGGTLYTDSEGVVSDVHVVVLPGHGPMRTYRDSMQWWMRVIDRFTRQTVRRLCAGLDPQSSIDACIGTESIRVSAVCVDASVCAH